MKIGYVREIGFGVDIDIRREILHIEGIFKIYADSENSREEYLKMLSILSNSDEIFIWSIEELGDEQ